MSPFIEAVQRVFGLVMGLGSQQSLGDETVVASVATLVALVILRLSAKGAGMPTLGWVLDLGALAVAVGFALASEAAALLYILPLCKTAQMVVAVRIAAPILGLLVLGVPLAALMLRGNYGKALVPLLFALIAAAAVIAATGAMLASLHGELQEMSVIGDRKEQMELQLNKH